MADIRVFLSRAEQLSLPLEIISKDADCAAATALLAVHAAIALNDAVLIHLDARYPKGRNHRDAAELTYKACKKKHVETDGLKHLRALLSAKTNVSYGEVVTTLELALTLTEKSRRFQQWAYTILKVEGRWS